MSIELLDILKLAGFKAGLATKLVRHRDRRWPELRNQSWFELYQAYQRKPRFHDVKQIISFYGLSGTRAGFYGVYRVLGHRPAREGREWPRPWNQRAKFFYHLQRDTKFDDLRDRLIIDWGPGTLAWVQKLGKKPVVEILPAGRKLPRFSDYLEFHLTHDELKDLFENDDAHGDWRVSLSAVAGIYLILAQTSGHQYIGSASGAEGIWGRWRSYATSGHGGNTQLRNLIKRDPKSYPGQFVFSMLQVLPKTMTRDEVIQRERQYKNKLGTRATGLNSN